MRTWLRLGLPQVRPLLRLLLGRGRALVPYGHERKVVSERAAPPAARFAFHHRHKRPSIKVLRRFAFFATLIVRPAWVASKSTALPVTQHRAMRHDVPAACLLLTNR